MNSNLVATLVHFLTRKILYFLPIRENKYAFVFHIEGRSNLLQLIHIKFPAPHLPMKRLRRLPEPARQFRFADAAADA